MCKINLLIDLSLDFLDINKDKTTGISTQILVNCKMHFPGGCDLSLFSIHYWLVNFLFLSKESVSPRTSCRCTSAVLRKQAVLFNEMLSASELYFVLKSRQFLK